MTVEQPGAAAPSAGIVGAGMMGVVLANELAEAGWNVTLYEAADPLGGLPTWEDFGAFTWDRFYHCILPTDADLLDFLAEIGLGDAVRWTQTGTGVFIDGKTHPLNTALDFARFTHGVQYFFQSRGTILCPRRIVCGLVR